MDYQSLLFNPSYLLLGTPAVLTVNGTDYNITVLDKTEGVDTGNDVVKGQTIVPAGVLRINELTQLGLIVQQLETRNARILMNGISWNIESVRLKPTLKGELDGEAYLFLSKNLLTDLRISAAALTGSGFLNVLLDVVLIPPVSIAPAQLVGGGIIKPLSLTVTIPITTVFEIGAGIVGGGLMDAALTIVPDIQLAASLLGGGSLVLNSQFVNNSFRNAEPWFQQNSFNPNSPATVPGWTAFGTETFPLSVPTSGPLAAVTKDRVFLAGGLNTSTSFAIDEMKSAPINADGTLGAWVDAGVIPDAVCRIPFVQLGNRIHIIGGSQHNTSTGGISKGTFNAPINPDGTLGAFVAGGNLVSPRCGYAVAVNNPYLYIIGGLSGGNSSAVSSVDRATINGDGTLGPFTSYTNLPNPISDAVYFDTGTRIYIVGGFNGGSILGSTWYAVKNADGTLGAWTNAGALFPTIRFLASGFCTEDAAYLVGGRGNGFTEVNTIYRAPITAGGVLGTLVAAGNLAQLQSGNEIFLTSSLVYSVGSAAGAANPMTHAPFTGGLNDYSLQT